MENMQQESILLHEKDTAETVHWHTRPEILYQIYGNTRLTVGKEHYTLNSQDIIIVNAYTMHNHMNENGYLVRLQLNMPQIVRLLGISPKQAFICNSISGMEDEFGPLRSALAQFELLTLQSADPSLCTAAALQILMLLISEFTVTENGGNAASALTHLESAITYMEQHFQEPVTVHQIAAACHLSEGYLTHLFSNVLGVTPSGYLTSMRLDHAVWLLQNSTMRVSEIAAEAGFIEPRRFNDAFRSRFGMLPRKWRISQQSQGSRQVPDESLLSLLKQQLDTAVGQKKYRTLLVPEVDIHKIKSKVPDSLFQLLCAGQFSSLLDGAYREKLAKLQNYFQFREALISNPFVARVLPWIQTGSSIAWDFSIIDGLLDFLLSLKLKPMLSLSCIPDIFSKTDGIRFGNAVCSMPKDMEQWCQFITDFFIHLKNRYGREELSLWRCSVWTLQENMFQEFQEFYLLTCKTIRKVCPEISLGSPNIEITADQESIAFLNRFLTFCREKQWQPEFYLFYSYSGRKLIQIPGTAFADMLFTNSVGYMHDTCRQVRAFSDSPVYFSWNSSPTGCGDYFHDTAYKAANMISSLLDIAHKVKAIGYSVPIDISFLDSETSDFDGSFGLITRHGIPKASCFALTFLRELQGKILFQNENICVTGSKGSIQVLCWNNQNFAYRIRRSFSEKNSLNYLRQPVVLKAEEDIQLWADPFERHAMLDTVCLRICLKLAGLDRGQYQLTEAVVNEENGCAFHNWIKMGDVSLENPTDAEYLYRITVPLRRVHDVTVDEEFLLQHTLKPNEIYLASLQPLQL